MGAPPLILECPTGLGTLFISKYPSSSGTVHILFLHVPLTSVQLIVFNVSNGLVNLLGTVRSAKDEQRMVIDVSIVGREKKGLLA
jgi:hypothetical protein